MMRYFLILTSTVESRSVIGQEYVIDVRKLMCLLDRHFSENVLCLFLSRRVEIYAESAVYDFGALKTNLKTGDSGLLR